MPEPRRRILVSVEPVILGDALAGVLGERGDDVEVIDLRDLAATATGHYDAAIVTVALPDGVDADVVIELPDHEGNPGRGRLTARIELDGVDDLLATLARSLDGNRPANA